MRSTKFYRGVIAAGVAVVIAGCGGDGSTSEKAGGDVEPVTLRLGTPESKGTVYTDEVEEFARLVELRSDGSIDIEVVWETVPWTMESETELATMVGDGEIELALVPTRVWDQLGVASLQALQAPFLVDSIALLDQITSSDLAGEMLSGLDAVGTTGLALWPEDLRHPVSFADPLVTTADFQGAKLRVPPSNLSRAVARAIGAEPVAPKDAGAAVAAGEMDGAESAFVLGETLPMFGTFTANITLYPKANALVANAEMFDALSDEQQDLLQQAADDTRAHAIETIGAERDVAAAYCAAGGSVALADEGVVAELTAKAAPVFAELERDADTKRLIHAIREMKEAAGATAADTPIACEPDVDEDTPAEAEAEAEAANQATFPEGVYRAESDLDGVVTFEFRDGTWKRYFADGQLDCMATYLVRSGRIYLTMSTDSQYSCGNVPGSEGPDATWTLDGDQLRILDINGDRGAIADWSRPWTKIE